jgi:hypothetical protein
VYQSIWNASVHLIAHKVSGSFGKHESLSIIILVTH